MLKNVNDNIFCYLSYFPITKFAYINKNILLQRAFFYTQCRPDQASLIIYHVRYIYTKQLTS